MQDYAPEISWENIKIRAINQLKQIHSETHTKVVVALSGGKDSVTALQLVRDCLAARGWGLGLEAVHWDYGLRGKESDEDARFAMQFGARLGVPVKVIQAGPAPKTGIQEWARNLRLVHYQAEIAEGAIIVTGHHKDDLVETVLQRLARGTHPAGLLGMTWWQGGIWRPLLELSRAQIDRLAHRKNLPYRHDSSNDKLEYSRNRVRHSIVPELEAIHPGASEQVIKLATSCDELSQFVTKTVAVTLEQAQYRPRVDWLKSLPPAVASLVLGLMIQKARSADDRLAAGWPQQPGAPIRAFLAGLQDLGSPQSPSLRVGMAGGGYLQVESLPADNGKAKVAYHQEAQPPFAEVHGRHRRNLALRPLVAIIPEQGRLTAGDPPTSKGFN